MKSTDGKAEGQGRDVTRRDFLRVGAAGGAALGVAAVAQRAMAAEAPWEQRSDKKIRIGVVGGGFGLSFHWNEHPNCIVEAVSDLIPDRRDRLMKKYECEKSYESLEELILDPNIDAVAVFTGAPDHARHVMACMEHGKHAISAVPTCCCLEDAARMKEVKERTGLTYMMAETSYYRWETITARRLVEDGVLGELVYSEAEYYHPGIGAAKDHLSMRYGRRTWRYGFPPMFYPTHSTAFLVGVTGERLEKVSCIGTAYADPAWSSNIYSNPFANNMAMFVTDKGHPFRCNVGWDVFAHGERAQWFGRDGAMYMPNSGGMGFSIRLAGETTTVMPDYWHMLPEPMRHDSGHGKSHPYLSNEFIMALVEERAPAIDLYEALAYTVPGLVAHESALKGGEQLDIPSFDLAQA
ncbi:MAG: Gfo/Idh/MocA family oxidoreductase [bacterium]|nr:Gfo/Idh/MocA family oxidoreductase [bacterium]